MQPSSRCKCASVLQAASSDRTEIHNLPWDAEFTQELAAPELCVVVLECWDDDTVTGDDFLGTVAVPLAEVTAGKLLDLPLLAATLAPWPRKHGAPSLQVTFDLVYMPVWKSITGTTSRRWRGASEI